MEGRPLEHIELLTISKKDEEYYREWIGDDIQEIAQKCLGVRRWIRFRNAITVLSRLGYFTFTTLSSIQSPGEEFCDAQSTSRNFFKNLLMVMLNNELQIPRELPKVYTNLLHGIHNVTFFLFGDFYELAKRITNYTYYTSDGTSYQPKELTLLYKLIGYALTVRLMLNTTKQSQILEEKQATDPVVSVKQGKQFKSPSNKLDPSAVCHLCSETRNEATSTLCGHIFCWDCIHRWLKERGECPICRTPNEPSRLIHLMNYK